MRKIPKKEVDLELKKYNDEELVDIDIKKMEYKLTTLQDHMGNLNPNLKVIDDYYEKVTYI